jgi:hypothetical protein
MSLPPQVKAGRKRKAQQEPMILPTAAAGGLRSFFANLPEGRFLDLVDKCVGFEELAKLGHKKKLMFCSSQCEDCGCKARSYGLPPGDKRWCKPCGIKHEGAVSMLRKCEDCGVKVPLYGLPLGPKRWCRSCSEGHAGAVKKSKAKMCETCNLKTPSFGLPSDGKKRWCSGCSQAQAGAVCLAKRHMCELCGIKQPHYRLEGDTGQRKSRWCSTCSADPRVSSLGRVVRNSAMCEDCGVKQPFYGLLLTERKKRWCGSCSKFHPGTGYIEPLKKKIASPGSGARPTAHAVCV